MIEITLFGAGGRMGRAVLEALEGEADIIVAHAVDIPERAGEKIGSIILEGDSTESNFAADVWVDVSTGDAAYKHALRAESQRIPVLIGATGFDDARAEYLKGLKVAHIIAPNLSVGVNLLFDLAPKVRSVLSEGYDVAVTEIHHRHKKDAPSGTAKRLIEEIERVSGPVQATSLRLGEVVGEHHVIFASEGEEVELIHRAKSRLAFAKGVAPAVRFLAGMKEGSYTMSDVLGLS